MLSCVSQASQGIVKQRSRACRDEPGSFCTPDSHPGHVARRCILADVTIMRIRWRHLSLIACMALLSCRTMPPREIGFLIRSVTVHGTTYPYTVYVPRAFDASKRWPVILFLH